MTYRRIAGCFSVITALSLLGMTAAFAATVTVDIAQKTAICDTDAFTARVQRVVGDQVSVFISSTRPEPQQFDLKVIGVKPGDQDVYINGAYKGKRPATDFTNGIKLSVPGRIANPIFLRCIDSVRDRANAELKRIEPNQENEHQRVVATLRQAVDWVKSATMADKNSRSLDVIIAPVDSVLQLKPNPSVKQPEEAAKAYATACNLLQQARDRMYDNIKAPQLREATVLSMTPVDLRFSYYLVNGKAKGTAVLINNCDLSLTGKMTPVLPAGWKVSAKSLSFANLASGKSFKVDFALLPPDKASVPPASMSVQAAFKLGVEPYWAKLTMTATAKQGSTVTVPEVPKPEPATAPVARPGTPSGAVPNR